MSARRGELARQMVAVIVALLLGCLRMLRPLQCELPRTTCEAVKGWLACGPTTCVAAKGWLACGICTKAVAIGYAVKLKLQICTA